MLINQQIVMGRTATGSDDDKPIVSQIAQRYSPYNDDKPIDRYGSHNRVKDKTEDGYRSVTDHTTRPTTVTNDDKDQITDRCKSHSYVVKFFFFCIMFLTL